MARAWDCGFLEVVNVRLWVFGGWAECGGCGYVEVVSVGLWRWPYRCVGLLEREREMNKKNEREREREREMNNF